MKKTYKELLLPGILIPVVLLSGAGPASAAPRPAGGVLDLDTVPVHEGADSAQGRRPAASSNLSEPGMLLKEPASTERILLDEEERPVAPGLDLRSFQWLDSAGFMRGDVLTAKLGTPGLSLDYVDGGSVTTPGPLENHVEEAGAVAGVNGDFFDINNSGSALGAGLGNKGVVKGPNPGWPNAIGVDTDGLAQMTEMLLEGSIVTPTATVPLKGLNQNVLAVNDIGAYTSLWGAYSRDRATTGVSSKIEVLVTDGVVTGISPQPGDGALKENTIALVGRENGAKALSALKVGDKVKVSYGLKSSAGEMEVAIGGSQPLVRGGEVLPQGDKSVHPRTAVGFSKDRATMFLVTLDGRMADSRGMSLEELGAFMKDMGADMALNLDGGGSSTLVAREAGESGVDLENAPSDGYQRSVPNGLALFAAEGSGRPTGLRVVPEAGDADENSLRVFPGLSRELDALAHDETFAPVDVDAKYRSNPAAVGEIDKDGTFTARRSGDVTVTAATAGAAGELPLVVLGDLERVRPTAEKVSLKDASDAGTFGLVGYDADGFQAPIDPADVVLEYDTSKISIEPNDAGGFSVKAVADSAGVVVTATVKGVVSHVAVSVGLESRIAATFDDAAGWKWSGARSTGSLAPTQGRDGGTALQINYDFTQSTATRTSNAAPPKNITIDGQPQTIGLWVKGDGRGQWWSFSLRDDKGNSYPLYGPHITWTGWKYVEVDVPQGIAFPMTLTRFGIIETAATAKYAGSVAIDDITVKVAPSIHTPGTEQVADDVVITDGTALDGEDFTFAVVSDAQFTASDQSLVPAARRTLQEALAADPEFIVINGDWIDTAFPADLALARKVIEEELGDKVPWYYVPGNHEIYGPGTVDPFEAEFGPGHQSFVHKGTQFVLLDSSTGRLLGGGFDQWQMLRDSLDTARDNPAINGVVVLTHMPTRDPSPIKVSQLSSAVEVGVVEDWLSEFRRDSGKGAAYIGSHVGSFSANSVDGVPYIVNGNAGKAPSTAPAEGGFSGWSLVGINPSAEPAPLKARHRAAPESDAENPWLEVEMRPHVDKLAIDNPGTMAVGTSASLDAHVTQGRRTFPVDYPVSADWASENVHIGPVAEAPGASIAAYDPETDTLTALRAGEGTLSITVNGVTETTPVTVTG